MRLNIAWLVVDGQYMLEPLKQTKKMVMEKNNTTVISRCVGHNRFPFL